MNLLIEKTPDFLNVGGNILPIKTDFSLWVEFIIASRKEDAESVFEVMQRIFGRIPTEVDYKELIKAIKEWLWQCEKRTFDDNNASSRDAFDFAEDGNVIFCELWEYFPHLMQMGVSFPEGIELIKLLLSNDKTMIHHRGFARCGDFSKLPKEQKQFWMNERAKYVLKSSQEDIDEIFSSVF